MTILFAIILGLGLIYFWLTGHWFARLIMFLPIAFFLIILGANIVVGFDQNPAPLPWPVTAIIAVLSIAGGWFLAGLPARRRPILYQPPGAAHSWPPTAN